LDGFVGAADELELVGVAGLVDTDEPGAIDDGETVVAVLSSGRRRYRLMLPTFLGGDSGAGDGIEIDVGNAADNGGVPLGRGGQCH